MRSLPASPPVSAVAWTLFVAASALGPGEACALVRAGAGLALEMAPVIVLTSLAAALGAGRSGRTRRLAGLLAGAGGAGCCGPGGRANGAWAPPTVVLTVVLFGWPLALARAAAAALAERLAPARRGFAGRDVSGGAPRPDGLARALGGIAASGAGAQICVALLPHAPAWPHGFAAVALGALAGLLGPCGAGSVALAATAGRAVPAFGAGVLATSGILRWPGAGRARHDGETPSLAVALVLAAICAVAAIRGGAGLVSPRFVPLLAAGAAGACGLAALRAARGERGGAAARPHRPLAAAASLAAAFGLALAAPATPPAATVVSSLDGSAPGDRLTFVGRAVASGGTIALERWQIWCCVADATALDVPLRGARPATGAWVRATGRIVRTPGGLALAVDRLDAVPAPADPYVYA